jgi:hypothetical protein
MAVGVRVRERDDEPGAWWLYLSYRGHRKAKRVGVGKDGRKAAEAAAIQLRARLAQGDLSCFEEAPAPKTQMTFELYARRWLAETITPHRKARTADYYEQVLDTHFLPAFGTAALAAIKPANEVVLGPRAGDTDSVLHRHA